MSDHRKGDEYAIPLPTGFCSRHRDGEDRNCDICYPSKETSKDEKKYCEKWERNAWVMPMSYIPGNNPNFFKEDLWGFCPWCGKELPCG